jgi:hypothetical protein
LFRVSLTDRSWHRKRKNKEKKLRAKVLSLIYNQKALSFLYDIAPTAKLYSRAATDVRTSTTSRGIVFHNKLAILTGKFHHCSVAGNMILRRGLYRAIFLG